MIQFSLGKLLELKNAPLVGRTDWAMQTQQFFAFFQCDFAQVA
jgi:hypothetical protein